MDQTITLETIVGLDVSEKYIQYCELTTDGTLEDEGRFANTRERLRKRFTREPVTIALEVGSHSRWIAEELVGLGHHVMVLDPRRLKMISDTVYKTDKRDAETLALLALECPRLLKTVEPRGDREQLSLTLVRTRQHLVEMRTKATNSVRGLLKPWGVRVGKKGGSPNFPAEVRKVAPEVLVDILNPQLRVIEELNRAVKELDHQVKTRLPEVAPDALHLLEIDGVGPTTLLYFVSLVGDPHRFPKSRNIGSYFGLCRRLDDSGDKKSERGITKAGDTYMRVLLANCASHIIGPFGKDCDLRRWGVRLAGNSKAQRKRARTAVSRKLAVIMLSMWKTGQAYVPFRNPDALQAAA